MQIRINDYITDSIVDGPGLRLAIFCQGCKHNCPGCHNPETHDIAGGNLIETAELIAILDKNPLLSGITLSGGEPILQAAACAEMALAAKNRNKNVWLYSGFMLEELHKQNDEAIELLLSLTDVLVDGKFILSERSLDLQYRGSHNQRLIDIQKSTPDKIIIWQDPYELLF